MAGIRIEGNTSGNVAEVNTGNEVKVALNSDPDLTGFINMSCESSTGEFLGAPVRRPADITHDSRLRVGSDNIVFNEWFAGTTVNSTIWATPQSTATVTQAGGFLNVNAASSLTATQGAMFKSWRTFPVFGTFTTYFEFLVKIPLSGFNNAKAEWGAALHVSTVASDPADGAFFRLTSSGLECVLVNNASEITSTAISSVTLTAQGIDINETNHYIISIGEDSVEYWIEDYMVANITRPAGGIAPTASQMLAIYGRVYNTGTNTGNALRLQVAMCNVSFGDMETAKFWGLS